MWWIVDTGSVIISEENDSENAGICVMCINVSVDNNSLSFCQVFNCEFYMNYKKSI